MGLNIKNSEVERLATEIAASTGETKTEAIRQALLLRAPTFRRATGCCALGKAVRETLAAEGWPLVLKGNQENADSANKPRMRQWATDPKGSSGRRHLGPRGDHSRRTPG